MSAQERPKELADLPALVRAKDLRELGLTRTDADRVMHLCGRETRLGKAIYVRREDVERVMAEAEQAGLR